MPTIYIKKRYYDKIMESEKIKEKPKVFVNKAVLEKLNRELSEGKENE